MSNYAISMTNRERQTNYRHIWCPFTICYSHYLFNWDFLSMVLQAAMAPPKQQPLIIGGRIWASRVKVLKEICPSVCLNTTVKNESHLHHQLIMQMRCVSQARQRLAVKRSVVHCSPVEQPHCYANEMQQFIVCADQKTAAEYFEHTLANQSVMSCAL